MMSRVKFEQIERFDGNSNFSIQQSTVKDVLVQHGLLKALQGKKPEKMSDENWEELEARAVSTIRLSLAPELQYRVLNEKSPFKLWENLKKFYMSKFLTNRLYMKKQLYKLKMSEETNVRDHINNFNKCITQLLSVEVKIDDEDKAIILLASLSKLMRLW